MNRPPLLLSVLAVALLFLTSQAGAQEKIVLRQHWEPGKVYHFEMNIDMDMTIPGLPGGGGQTTTVIQQMNATVSKEPGSDRKLIETKYVGTKAMMNTAGQLMTYDSSDPAMSQPLLQQAFGGLINKSITLIYDKDDKFIDAVVPEGVLPTPLGQGKGPDGKQLADMLRQSMDFGLPSEGLAVGDTFNVEKKVQMQPLGTVSTKMKGRLDSIVTHEGRNHAKLIAEGTMDLSELPAGTQNFLSALPGMKITSETLFDLERKAMSVTTVHNDMKMSAGGKEMTMKQTVVSTLKSIEDAPAAAKK